MSTYRRHSRRGMEWPGAGFGGDQGCDAAGGPFPDLLLRGVVASGLEPKSFSSLPFLCMEDLSSQDVVQDLYTYTCTVCLQRRIGRKMSGNCPLTE